MKNWWQAQKGTEERKKGKMQLVPKGCRLAMLVEEK